jgi:sulfite reductase (ferredoxin)
MADTPTPVRHRESFGDAREAAEFVEMLERFERGELSSEQYRHYRLSRGIYGQRQEGQHMVRVKIPQGILSSAQLRVLADCADRYSGGHGHVTTRQNFQFHHVRPEHVSPFLEAIALSGLTTREACSHTVRNVVGCPYAGVCGHAPFDITPYAEAMTRHFLRGPLGSGLPRKFKISASGCEDDCALGAMNDIGIIARVQEGRRGFRLLAGGGTATLSRSAGVLNEFLPAEHLLAACEAILRVFNAEGERKNLQKARMKWAIQRLGWEGFRARYQQELEAILAEGGRPLPPLTPEEEPPSRPARAPANVKVTPAFLRWKSTNARPQAQAGWVAATVRLELGDISSEQMRGLADLVEQLGDGTVRTTLQQNLLARWVREEELAELWHKLEALGLARTEAASVVDVVSCPGAETCAVAVTASRGMAQLLGNHLSARGAAEGLAATADIKVSGCPNGCGQNHVAAIGLQGGVRKLGEKLVPQYHLTIGGGVDRRGATFGRLVAKIPARRVPEAVDRLIAHYTEHRQESESPRAYFQRMDLSEAKRLVTDLAELDEAKAREEDFIDLQSKVEFKVVALDPQASARLDSEVSP